MKVTIDIDISVLKNIMTIIERADPLKLMVSQKILEDMALQVQKQIKEQNDEKAG
jgi:hypothetical protein